MEQNNRIHDVAMSNEHVLMMMMYFLPRYELVLLMRHLSVLQCAGHPARPVAGPYGS